MKTNRPEINIAEGSDDENKCKRKWIKPEVEVISRDLIKNGAAASYAEGAPTPYSLISGGS